ncbi:very short patch repair endonuclease [Acuticoccus sediminis]|uniref:Very short patch repair endonuclease n=1 Tax=Acuticoccus sediminis TaxID=2184697 RepID=A0A8B2NWR5_9HYPH|nr:very short patch repair endonuclease [Acuticoccus sediminis]RAI01792.1 very short patch repair endonuclease [Acuticoccus sediminis]
MNTTSGHRDAVRRIRRLLHAAGYRFRTRAADLPGTPDIVVSGRRCVVLVRDCAAEPDGAPGCSVCGRSGVRGSGPERWQGAPGPDGKADLEAGGWTVLVLTTCEAGDPSLEARLEAALGPPPGRSR